MEDCRIRIDQVRKWAEELFALADKWVAENPEIID